jgi:hypothetical protein
MTTSDHAAVPPLSAGGERRRQRASARWQKVQSAWRSASRRVPAIRADLTWYAGIQMDRARLRLTRLSTRIALGLLALLAVATVFAIAAWLLVAGIAGGVGELLDGRLWLGQAATGAVTLLLLFGSIGGGLWLRRRSRLQHLRTRHAALAGGRTGSTSDGGKTC